MSRRFFTGLAALALAAGAAVELHAPRGDADGAARRSILAARLAPGDGAADRRAERALDGALVAQMRPAARGTMAVSGAVLLLAFVGSRRRAGLCRRQRAYVEHLDGSLVVRPDGPMPSLDVYLHPRAGLLPHRTPRHGPTLSVVLSSASASRTIRLPAVKDVRGDAVRLHLSETTRAALRAHPGSWRAQARLDGRLVAQAPVEVA